MLLITVSDMEPRVLDSEENMEVNIKNNLHGRLLNGITSGTGIPNMALGSGFLCLKASCADHPSFESVFFGERKNLLLFRNRKLAICKAEYQLATLSLFPRITLSTKILRKSKQ